MSVVVSKNNRWSTAWDDILSGGNPRWKISSEECHNRAYEHFRRFVPVPIAEDDDKEKKVISVFCPLAGDDPFVPLLYKKGYHVTAIDLVPEAIEAMKKQFGDNDDDDSNIWTKKESSSSDEDDNNDDDIIWTHKSGRVTLIVGDALKKRSYLNNSFDAVYDKDSFGALPISMRKSFCSRISEYTKINGILYLECKLKQPAPSGTERNGQDDDNGGQGPPFSLTRDDLMENDNYGGSNKFEYVEGLGIVYELAENFATMKQTGHVLRRCTK